MKNNPDISGFILAGGKSSRMGTDKALLNIQDEPLLRRMIGLIVPFCRDVAVSGQNPGYAVFGTPMIPDLYAGCGPIAGIYSCLEYAGTDWNLIISVDAPFVNHELIGFLISEIGDSDCIVPRHSGGYEPLVGLYHKRIIPVIEEMIKKGDYKLMNLLSKLNTRFLDCDPLIRKYPRLFTNINRPEDYNSI